MPLAPPGWMLLDIRAAIRSLARTPAFLVGTVLTLGLALGFVTTATGLLAGALFGDAPRDRVVVYLTERIGNGQTQQMRWPYPAVRVVSERATSFEQIATYTTTQLNVSGGGGDRLDAELISPAYFDIVGVAPALGRVTGPSNPSTPSPDEIVIGDGVWKRVFGSDPGIVGREIVVSRRPLRIVGVMPPDFRGLSGRADAWIPFSLAPVISFGDYFTSTEYFHNVIARLRPNVSIDSARSEIQLLAAHIAEAVPPRSEQATNRSAHIVTLNDARVSAGVVRARVLILIGALLVLLIAAVNVATLVIARLGSRQREFAVRLAVGGGRAHVLRAVAVEMGLVTAIGLIAALIASLWARDVITAAVPAAIAAPANDYGQLASFAGFAFDLRVILVVAVLAVATTLLVALPVCRRMLRDNLVDLLKRTAVRGSTGPRHHERALLSVQIAVSLALLMSAALLFRTIDALERIDPGFDTRHVLAFSLAEDLAVQSPGRGPTMVERVLASVSAVPGVVAATVAQSPPFNARGARLQFVLADGTASVSNSPVVGWHRVGPNHFDALRIPVLRGRGFTDSDRRGAKPVVVINETAARRFFSDRDPIGQRVRLPETLDGDDDIAEIVGVVGNVLYWPLDQPPGPDVYQPALQFSYTWTTVMVRTAGDPIAAVPALRAAVASANANLPLFDIVTLDDMARAGRGDRGFLSTLLALCAALGLSLAAVGVYAITASWMEARRRELGVRLALGAQPRTLVTLVMRSALRQAVFGVAVGVVIALVAGRGLEANLYGVGAADPATLMAVVMVMLAVTATAAYLPARRALGVDPVRELNSE